MTKGRVTAAVLAVSSAVLLAACGDSNQVGSSKLFKFSPRPAAPSPSPSPSPASVAPPPAPTQTHQAPPPPPASTFTITIASGTGTFGNSTVKAGTIVKWVNQDSVPRGVKATSPAGAFDSGLIPPGGSYSHTFAQSGSFQYQDSTRPWVTGTLTVQ
jgi:plastocyanin